MKTNTLLAAIAVVATMLAGGCCHMVDCGDTGPVAPKEQSSEKSQSGEPQLPETHVWWN